MSIVSKDSCRQNSNLSTLSFIFSEISGLSKLPTPTRIYLINRGCVIEYDLNCYFGTTKGQEFYTDAVKRFCLTYGCKQNAVRMSQDAHQDNGLSYELSEITKELVSLKRRFTELPQAARAFEDEKFWQAKIWCEREILDSGLFTYNALERFLLSLVGERSTARAKAKSIFNWYVKRDFKPSKRTHQMSRTEHIKKVNEQRKASAKEAVLKVAETFKFLNQKMTAKAVGEAARLDQRTASKYLKELKAEGLI